MFARSSIARSPWAHGATAVVMIVIAGQTLFEDPAPAVTTSQRLEAHSGFEGPAGAINFSELLRQIVPVGATFGSATE